MALTAREKARLVDCPKCGARAGQHCWTKGAEIRVSCHRARHQAAKASKQFQPKPLGPNKGYGVEWPKTRAKVFAEKGSQCHYCGADAWHVDHIVPKSKGGKDELDNLVPACGPCNIRKGDR